MHVDGHGIEKKHVGTDGQVLNCFDHGQFAGAQNIDGVDRLRLDDADRDSASLTEDQTADVDAVFAADELGIVDADEGGLGVENDAGGDDRPGQTAAAYFVRSGDGAETKIAEPALDR